MLHLLLFLVLVSVSSTDEAPKIPDGYKKCPVPTRYNSGGWLKSTELCPKMNHSCMAVLASGGKFKDGGCVLNLNYSFYHPNKTVYDAHDWKKACDTSTGIHTLWTEMDGTLRVKVCCNETCPLNPYDWKDTLQNPWLPYVVGIIGGLISSGYTLSFTHTCYVKCRAKKVVLKAKRRRSKKPKKIMRSLVALMALVAISITNVIPRGEDAFLHGAVCQPCIQLITNGENREEGNFDKWFKNETDKVCSGLGILKTECQSYFMMKEEEINHLIDTKAEPKLACEDLDMCDK